MNPHLIDHVNSYRLAELRNEASTQAAVSRARRVRRERTAAPALARVAALLFAGGRNASSAGRESCRACGCVAGA